MQKVVRGGVLGELRSHRSDHRKLVGVLGDVGKQRADLGSTLTVLIEFPRACEEGAVVVELRRGDFEELGRIPAVVLGQQRFGIKRVDLRGPAVHIEENNALGFGRKMVLAIQRSRFLQERFLGSRALGLREHGTQGHSAEAVGRLG